MLQLSKAATAALIRNVSKDETRRALNLVRLEKDYAVATDGHRLVAVRLPEDHDVPEGFLRPGALAAKPTNVFPPNGHGCIEAEQPTKPGQPAVRTLHEVPEDVTFPKWKDVCPGIGGGAVDLNQDDYVRIGWSPEVLREVLAAFDPQPLHGPVEMLVKLPKHGPEGQPKPRCVVDAVILRGRTAGGEECYGLAMPMRLND